MPRRQGYALLIALVAGTAALAAAIAFATSYITGNRQAPRTGHEAPAAARNPAAPAASTGTWVTTWTAAPVGGEPGTAHGFPGSTIRNVVHTSIGGEAARITVSNLFGTVPLIIDRATVGARPVTFRGSPTVTIGAGLRIVSDPVAVPVAADADLTVALRTPESGGPVTYHPNSHQTSYLDNSDGTRPTTRWRYLTAVDVRNEAAAGAIVALGDSLTAGSGSTTDANRRWPDVLADRLDHRYGVANQGIAGNRLLRDGKGGRSGTGRYERDVLSVAGAKSVIVALGINDVQQAPQEQDAQRVVDGLRSLTARAHARGMRVIGTTLTPFQGWPTWTPERNAVRLAVNERIRAGGVFDEVVDFDRAVRDPYAPNRILPEYDSGDRLHLNDDGYRALGRSIGLRLLTGVPASGEF